MLASAYVGLRCLHFITVMLSFGCVLYGAWWATPQLRRLMMLRFMPLLRVTLLINAVSATLMLMLQGGLMANGWGDVLQPDIWLAVTGTRFGSIWQWQILLTWVALAIVCLRPHRLAPLLLILCVAQLLLMAGVGHAAMQDGAIGALQRLNHAIHLLCAGAWFGGLLPFLYCLHLAKGPWRTSAINTMMRFSRYGHLAVAGVVLSGITNAWLIQGQLVSDSGYGRLLLVKCALVALMVVIALANRYVLVPRMASNRQHCQALFLRTTQLEMILGTLVLATVSLFATWEPF
ncbi:copper homeostasis membrane protein CopD [Scandinavium sp. M-37]|uniref:copper homeostasis membrane protein CopD n=1 Tax=Scandinavium sp. M-37 TaxID=3373077 RepID=UPI003744CFA0